MTLRYAVVGAGPAGFYAAATLLRRVPEARVDILESLPVPFGLVRYGVAPDHPATKAVTSLFSRFVAEAGTRVRFFGNVPVSSARLGGSQLPPLSELYDLVVYATGAARPRTFDNASTLPAAVRIAQDFVFWINGHPHMHGPSAPPAPFASGCDRVIVIGAGNVSLDIARLLLRKPDDLRSTDISPIALEAITKNPVSAVDIFARRGPQHAAWTTAAIRELLTKIPGVRAQCDPAVVAHGQLDTTAPKTANRMLKLLAQHAAGNLNTPKSDHMGDQRLLRLHFHLSPFSFKSIGLYEAKAPIPRKHSSEGLLVSFEDNYAKNARISPGSTQQASLGIFGRADTRDHCEKAMVTESCGMVFLSLGYEGGKPIPGQICVGWANGKGKGIIGDNKWDAESVVARLTDHQLGLERPNRVAVSGIDDWLSTSGIESVSWTGWERIDAEERQRGKQLHPDRERLKVESIPEMLAIAAGQSPMSKCTL